MKERRATAISSSSTSCLQTGVTYFIIMQVGEGRKGNGEGEGAHEAVENLIRMHEVGGPGK